MCRARADLDDIYARLQASGGDAAPHDVEHTHLLAVATRNGDVAVMGIDP